MKEYKNVLIICTMYDAAKRFDEKMNEMSQQGWQFVTSTVAEGFYVLTFSRELDAKTQG